MEGTLRVEEGRPAGSHGTYGTTMNLVPWVYSLFHKLQTGCYRSQQPRNADIGKEIFKKCLFCIEKQ
jgi:hypothetical protein